ncbi:MULTISPECIES: HNH endonuclease [unclassified Variovorax]|uniref:HNH endonuclease n=1 Tax=unclassified Variovorax TaxID=663243 RepID=UPI00177BA7AE|nr:HNH endonuclease [Variovorax sp. VRV01]MBD9663219.1 HNH endonuclease [Variovorax sp. VRV01]
MVWQDYGLTATLNSSPEKHIQHSGWQMSKKYRGKTCVYCAAVGASETADHVVCREFFPLSARDNLPKVPSCQMCNGEKSYLEHYLTAVMPFGGAQAGAQEMLEEQISRRLERNEKLRAELSAGFSYRFVSKDGGPWQRQLAISFDGDRLNRLFGYILRGLAFHHWGLVFNKEHAVSASFVGEVARPLIEESLAQDGVRITGRLGDGVFVYEGLQAQGDPYLTIWRMSLYGSEVLAQRPSGRMTWAYGLTAPRSSLAAAEFVQMLQNS